MGGAKGNEFSDVDGLTLASGDQIVQISASTASKLTAISTPVLANRLFGGRVLNVVTEPWNRFDLGIVESADLDR